MSKTSRRERTKGNLAHIEKIRRERKLIRSLKADELFNDSDDIINLLDIE